MAKKNVNAEVIPNLIKEIFKLPQKLSFFIQQACFKLNKSKQRNKPQEFFILQKIRAKVFEGKTETDENKNESESVSLSKVVYPGEIIFIKDIHHKLQLVSQRKAMFVDDLIEFVSLNIDEDFNEAKLRVLSANFDAFGFAENERLDKKENALRQKFDPLNFQLGQIEKQRKSLQTGE